MLREDADFLHIASMSAFSHQPPCTGRRYTPRLVTNTPSPPLLTLFAWAYIKAANGMHAILKLFSSGPEYLVFRRGVDGRSMPRLTRLYTRACRRRLFLPSMMARHAYPPALELSDDAISRFYLLTRKIFLDSYHMILALLTMLVDFGATARARESMHTARIALHIIDRAAHQPATRCFI